MNQTTCYAVKRPLSRRKLLKHGVAGATPLFAMWDIKQDKSHHVIEEAFSKAMASDTKGGNNSSEFAVVEEVGAESGAEGQSAESGTDSGGGDEESSGGDDDEPPSSAIIPSSPEWWHVSLTIALIVVVSTLLIWLCLARPNRFTIPSLILAFLSTFGIVTLFDPKLFYRRMVGASFATLSASFALGGVQIQIPSDVPLTLVIPEMSFGGHLLLAVLIVFLTILDWIERRSVLRE